MARPPRFHFLFAHTCLKIRVILKEAGIMNRNNGARPTIQGALRTPYPSPRRPKFASCDRLPPAQIPRRTWANFFEDLWKFFIGIGIAIILTDLVLQIIVYGFLQRPLPRPDVSGRKTHYDSLEIDFDADQDAITTAWRMQEWNLHPDNVGNTDETREAYYWVQLAYVELSDPLARCYHDQYHGFLPRKFGKDDPCISILTELARKSRSEDESQAESHGREGILFAEAARDKAYEKWARWRDAMAEKARQVDKDGDLADLAGRLQKLAKQIAAWPFIAIGFLFGLLELLTNYFGELAERYEWRQRFFRYIYL